jgi:6-pyruvoyltetrahydropterin/6-carboxytetrahydropterin synthase
MIKITKQFRSETSHIVRNAFSERCKYNQHGHSYVYEVSIVGEVSETSGMVLDFKELQPIKSLIDMFDHCAVLWEGEQNYFKDFFKKEFKRVLVMKKNPTAENMVRIISKFVSQWLSEKHPHCCLHSVRVWETVTGSAEGNEFDDDDVFTFVSEDCRNG